MGITYLCECGCTHAANELILVHTGQFRGDRKRCRDHKATELGNIKKKFNTCAICKITFEVKVSGRARIKCDKCAKKKVPSKPITLDCQKILDEGGFVVIPGRVTNFYECGCVVPNMLDSQQLNYFTKTKTRRRSCPFHREPKSLIAKYKICKNCGKSQTGWKLQSSEFCQLCATNKKIYAKGKRKTLNNAAHADPDRWDCSERDICFEQYIRHAAIPCKHCERYDPIPLEQDPFRVSIDEMAVYSNYIYL